MTNADKLLKDGVTIDDFEDIYHDWLIKDMVLESEREIQLNRLDSVMRFLRTSCKPTLTEEERVILRNVKWNGYSATHIGRARENKGSFIYLRFENDIEMTYFFDNFFRALIPIYKRGRRIRNKRIVRRE